MDRARVVYSSGLGPCLPDQRLRVRESPGKLSKAQASPLVQAIVPIVPADRYSIRSAVENKSREILNLCSTSHEEVTGVPASADTVRDLDSLLVAMVQALPE